MKKGLLFKLHLFTGLVSGIFIFVICLSGSLLVFHAELDKMSRPAFKVSDRPLITLDSAYSSVRRSYPNAQVSNCEFPGSVKDLFLFSIYDRSFKNGSKPFPVFVHPQTGMTMDFEPNRSSFMKTMTVLHNSFLAGKKGEWILGVMAGLFLFSLLTGCVLYRHSLLDTLLFRKTAYRKGSLHQVIGTWALVFNLVMGATGLWMQRYVFKSSFYQTNDYRFELKASPPLSFRFDSAYRGIREQYPDFTGHVVYFAQTPKGKTAVYGSNRTNSFIHSEKFADAVMLDSAGHIARTAFVNEIDADSRFDIINAQLHYGQYGGLPVKILYCLFGISGALLSMTGFVLWFRRKRRSGI